MNDSAIQAQFNQQVKDKVSFHEVTFETPKKVDSVQDFQEFEDKHHQIRKNRMIMVDRLYDQLLNRLRGNAELEIPAEDNPAVYVGGNSVIGIGLQKKLLENGFPIICFPAKKPVWIAITIGS